VFIAEVIPGQITLVKCVHGGTGILFNPNAVSVKFLPPIKRGGDISPNKNHPSVFGMDSATGSKLKGKVPIPFTNPAPGIRFPVQFCVRHFPTVLWIPHPVKGFRESRYVQGMNLNHVYFPFFGCF
jgi:hypothetical protein